MVDSKVFSFITEKSEAVIPAIEKNARGIALSDGNK